MVIIMFEAARDYVCVYVCAPEVCVFAGPTLSRVGCNMWAASALARCIVCRVLTLSPPSPSLSLYYSKTNCSHNCANDQLGSPLISPDQSEHANEPGKKKKKPKRANKISATELIKKL